MRQQKFPQLIIIHTDLHQDFSPVGLGIGPLAQTSGALYGREIGTFDYLMLIPPQVLHPMKLHPIRGPKYFSTKYQQLRRHINKAICTESLKTIGPDLATERPSHRGSGSFRLSNPEVGQILARLTKLGMRLA
jgi:hypothetical protein